MAWFRTLGLPLAAISCLIIMDCGDSDPVNPGFYPKDRSAFVGLWQGNLDGSIVFPAFYLSGSEYLVHDMSCRLEFKQFGYELRLTDYEEGRETIYFQKGNWAWKSQNPGVLEFFDDSISLSQSLESQTRRITRLNSAPPVGSWTGNLEFTSAELTEFRLSGFADDLSLLNIPDSIPMLLSK